MRTTEFYTCMHNFYSTHLTSDFTNYCINACPEKCNTVEYELTVNSGFYTNLNTMYYIKYSEGKLDYIPDDDNTLLWYGLQSLMYVNINYQNLYYTLVEENAAMTFQSLLGTVGGQLGLFIGISFLSLIEIIEIAIELAYFHYKFKNEKSKTLQISSFLKHQDVSEKL